MFKAETDTKEEQIVHVGLQVETSEWYFIIKYVSLENVNLPKQLIKCVMWKVPPCQLMGNPAV